MRDPGYGALLLSLDFEIHWGVFDLCDTDSDYAVNLLGVRTVVPRMLKMFQERGISATWATVGALFATSREHLEKHRPVVRPHYQQPKLDPYTVPLGEGEADDPFHYAPTLIRQVMDTPGQELGCHTFSHIYWDEPGQTAEAVRADLDSARSIMADYNLRPVSLVFPRNQVNPELLCIAKECGFQTYRGMEPHWMYKSGRNDSFHRLHKRLGRFIDRYVSISGHGLARWDRVVRPDGLVNLPSTRYLQPKTPWPRFETQRLEWMQAAIADAAKTRRLVHFWWHPHDYGANPDENLSILEALLDTAVRYRDSHGLRSLTMGEAAQTALRL